MTKKMFLFGDLLGLLARSWPSRSKDGRSNRLADGAAVQLRALAHGCAREALRTNHMKAAQNYLPFALPDERPLARWALCFWPLRLLCLARLRLHSLVDCVAQQIELHLQAFHLLLKQLHRSTALDPVSSARECIVEWCLRGLDGWWRAVLCGWRDLRRAVECSRRDSGRGWHNLRRAGKCGWCDLGWGRRGLCCVRDRGGGQREASFRDRTIDVVGLVARSRRVRPQHSRLVVADFQRIKDHNYRHVYVIAFVPIVSILHEDLVCRAIAVWGRTPLPFKKGPQPVREFVQHLIDGCPSCFNSRDVLYYHL